MSVYCLTLELSGPPASSDRFIHIDGVLAYGAAVETVGHDGLDELEDSGPPEYWLDAMPLARYEHGDQWVWAASAQFAAFDETGEAREPPTWTTARWRSRFDHVQKHQKKRTQVATSSGPFKSYDAALPYAVTDRAHFLLELAADASPEDVLALIKAHITHIGKKSSQGYGLLQDASLARIDELDSAIHHDGQTMRSLPMAFLGGVPDGIHVEQRTTRPPYWHPHNQTLAVPPFVALEADDLDCEVTA